MIRAMSLGLLFALLLATAPLALADDHDADRQYYEWRTYHLDSHEQMEALDAYLEEALLPALQRLEIGPVGVFTDHDPDDTPNLYVLLPFDDVEQFTSLNENLQADDTYQADAADYFDTSSADPRFARIESEFLLAFESFPQVHVPEQKEQGEDRLFEFRLYESHSEHAGNLKVEMFDEGETDIFLNVNIQPVFMGQALAGQHMPNLTYLAVYPDMETREQVWDTFLDHPDWEEMSSMERYEDTVSRIHEFFLLPRPYSQL